MLVTNIQRFCLDDGPGIRTTVFLAGCNLRCHWCHNPESVYEEAICKEAREMSAEAIWNEAVKDIAYFRRSHGGITFSGGEPMMQHTELGQLLRMCKHEGMHTAIETAGKYPFEWLEELLDYIDFVMIDCKAFSAEIHYKCTGTLNAQILENIKKLRKTKKEMLVRIPVIWGVNITSDELNKIGSFLQKADVNRVELIPYHKWGISKYAKNDLEYILKGQEEPTEEQLRECKDILGKYQINVVE